MDRPDTAVRDSAPNRTAARALLLVLAVVVSLGLAEIATRILVTIMERPSIVVRDADAGWSLAPNLNKVVVTGNGGSYRRCP